jgi:hypothetical protein
VEEIGGRIIISSQGKNVSKNLSQNQAWHGVERLSSQLFRSYRDYSVRMALGKNETLFLK